MPDSIFEYIRKVRIGIHVIEIYVHGRLFDLILKNFHEKYRYKRKPIENKTYHSFFIPHGNREKKISLIKVESLKNKDRIFYHYIIIKNPNLAIQKFIYEAIQKVVQEDKFLKETNPNNACNIKKVELFHDFFPNPGSGPAPIFDYLISGLDLKYSKGTKNYFYKKGTFYVAPDDTIENNEYNRNLNKYNDDANPQVHHPLHSMRIYFRPKEGRKIFVRYEYNANKKRLKSLNLRKIDNLPDINSKTINPFQYLIYRKRGEHKVNAYLEKKLSQVQKEKQRFKESPGNWMVYLGHLIRDSHNLGGYVDSSNVTPYVQAFRRLKKELGITYPVDRFFPSDTEKMEEIKRIIEIKGCHKRNT